MHKWLLTTAVFLGILARGAWHLTYSTYFTPTIPLMVRQAHHIAHGEASGNWAKSSGPKLSMSVSCDGGYVLSSVN